MFMSSRSAPRASVKISSFRVHIKIISRAEHEYIDSPPCAMKALVTALCLNIMATTVSPNSNIVSFQFSPNSDTAKYLANIQKYAIEQNESRRKC